MPEYIDKTGKTFGRWTVLYRLPNRIDRSGNPHTMFRCKCECGTEKDVQASSLYSGRSTSCGCVHKEKAQQTAADNFSTHKHSKERLYRIWNGMKRRCFAKGRSNYDDYGGRGITICAEWLDYATFRAWAVDNGYDDTKTIDRIDNDGNYEPSNCRWTTRTVQANNRRSSKLVTHNDETKTLAEWARFYDVDYKKLYWRLEYGGLSFEESVEQLKNQ